MSAPKILGLCQPDKSVYVAAPNLLKVGVHIFYVVCRDGVDVLYDASSFPAPSKSEVVLGRCMKRLIKVVLG
jgi:hypothetical protein